MADSKIDKSNQDPDEGSDFDAVGSELDCREDSPSASKTSKVSDKSKAAHDGDHGENVGLGTFAANLLEQYKEKFFGKTSNSENSAKESGFHGLKVENGVVREVKTPEGKFIHDGTDANGKDKWLKIAPGSEEEKEFKGSIAIKNGKLVVSDHEKGSAQEYKSQAVTYQNLDTTADGKVQHLETPEHSYRLVGTDPSTGNPQYLVTTANDQEGRLLNGSVAVNNGKVTVIDSDAGVSKEYRSTEPRSTNNSSILYESTRQMTVSVTEAFVGKEAAKSVDEMFKDPSKLQQWYADASRRAQEAQAQAQETNRSEAKPAGDPKAGEAKPIAGDVSPGEAKPAASQQNGEVKLANQAINDARLAGAPIDKLADQNRPAPGTEASKPASLDASKPANAEIASTMPATESKTSNTTLSSNIILASNTSEPQKANLLAPGSDSNRLNPLTNDATRLTSDATKTTNSPALMDSFNRQPSLEFARLAVQTSFNFAAADLKSSLLPTSPVLSKSEVWSNTSSPAKPLDKAFNSGSDDYLRRPLFVPQLADNREIAKAIPFVTTFTNDLARSTNPLKSTEKPFELPNTDKRVQELKPPSTAPVSLQNLDRTNQTVVQNKPTTDINTNKPAPEAASKIVALPAPSAAKDQPTVTISTKAPELTSPAIIPQNQFNPSSNQPASINPSRVTAADHTRPQQPGTNPGVIPGPQLPIRIDQTIAAPGIGPRIVGIDSIKGDPTGRSSGRGLGQTDASALTISSGKRSADGRYMIAELTLAMVLAAGGIRRILPTDKVAKDGSNGSGSGEGKRQIERDLGGKMREPVGAESMKFSLASYKLSQLSLKDASALKHALTTSSFESGKRLWMGPEGKQAFIKAFAERKEMPLFTSRAEQVTQIAIGFAKPQLTPLMADASTGQHIAMPADTSVLEQFLRGQQQVLDETLEPFINAANEFIEMDDPFEGFKAMFSVKSGTRRSRSKNQLFESEEEGNGISGNGDGGQDYNDDEQGKSGLVLCRPTWLIGEGETLISIAEEHFSDPYIGWLIADLNKGNCQEHWMDGKRIVEFQSRQQLTLPVWQDIVQFYGSMPLEARLENLVTIVSATQIDREVVDSVLGPIVGRKKSVNPNGLGNGASNKQANETKEAVLR